MCLHLETRRSAHCKGSHSFQLMHSRLHCSIACSIWWGGGEEGRRGGGEEGRRGGGEEGRRGGGEEGRGGGRGEGGRGEGGRGKGGRGEGGE